MAAKPLRPIADRSRDEPRRCWSAPIRVRKLSQLITYVGIALGLAAGVGFVLLLWPDIDLYGNKALRAVGGTFATAALIAVGVSWPFLWLADKISPKNQPVDSPPDATPVASDKRRHHTQQDRKTKRRA